MSTREDLKGLFQRGKPLVEEWLNIADDFADLREEARTKGLDWAQIKALLKAEIQDGRDGGDRVKKIVDKADLATAYIDMLGLSNVAEKFISRKPEREPDSAPPSSTPSTPASGGAEPAVASAAGERFTRPLASPPSGAPDDNEDIPAFLKRGDPACPVAAR